METFHGFLSQVHMRRINLKNRNNISKIVETLEVRPLLSTLVALVDTGVDLSSKTDLPYYDLAAGFNAYTQQTTAQAGDSIVQDNYDPPSGTAGHWHGSTVADNIIAGIQATESQPGATSAGVLIMPIRVTDGSGNIDANSIIRGVYYAANHGASVINLSILDTVDFTDTNASDPTFGKSITDAIAYAQSKNVVVVTAAGNNGVNIDNPANNTTLYPADDVSPNLLVVAAVDSSGNLSSVSNWGPVHVSIGADAPGNAPETSYAAGYTSGIVGVVSALEPSWTASKTVAYVEASAWPSPGLAGKTTSGGVINPTNAVYGIESPTKPLALSATGATGGSYLAATDVSGGGTSSTQAAIDTSGVTNPAPQVCTRIPDTGTSLLQFRT